MKLKKIQETDVAGKIVFLRVDLDVPIENGDIVDDSRLNAWFPTLEHLVRQNAQVVIAGHLGRPEGIDKKYSLAPVALWIAKKINSHTEEVDLEGFKAWKLAQNVFVLENLRFFKEEEENDSEFSKRLSSLAQIYVNDAFASSHRKHASIVGITQFLPSFAGLRLEKEMEELSRVLSSPVRPLTIIIGGAKIETKLPLVEKMHRFADSVLVGGELVENTKVLAKVAHEKIQGQKSELLIGNLIADGKDLTKESVEGFVGAAHKSGTIVWNGPMGLIEEEKYMEATKILAQGISGLSAYKIVGGGDTVAFLQKMNLLNLFDFVSIGGGAMLEFLSGETLPGLEVLQ